MRSRPRVEGALALLLYVGLTCAYFGWSLLPHPGRVVFGDENAPIYIWSFAWWPHALADGLNPFVSHALYAPYGIDLAWTPSAPGLAFLFSPLTALVGPVASYNVAGILMPALSAWAGYLLCRYLTRSMWAGLVGGYLFGFSTAQLRQVSPGNVNLSAVFAFPLVALLLIRRVRGELTNRGLAWRLGIVLALQLTISTELFAMLTLAVVFCWLLAFWLLPAARRALRRSILATLGGYVLAAVFVAPFTYYLLFHYVSARLVSDYDPWSTDVFASLVPNYVIGLGGNEWIDLQRHVSSRSAYLGLPTVVILLLYAWRARLRPSGRFAIAAFLLAFVATLGSEFQVASHQLFPLPWWDVAGALPALGDALPFRLGIFESLAAAVIVALWIASVRGRVFARPCVLPLLAVAALVPLVWFPSAFTPRTPQRVQFFTAGLYKRCIGPKDTIVAYPGGGDTLIWQAESGFAFNLAMDGLQPFPPGKPLNRFDTDPYVSDLTYAYPWRPTADRLLAFAATHHVARVTAVAGGDYPTPRELATIGSTQHVGGVDVAPACGSPPLTERNLTAEVRRWELSPVPTPRREQIGWCFDGQYLQEATGLRPPTGQTARHASYVQGKGITCADPPAGYVPHGFAGAAQGVRPGTYPYYVQKT